MAKKKRTGLDALQEYEAGSGYAASYATSYGQTQTQGKTTTFKRSGLDALREYEQYKNPGAVQDTTFDPNYRSRNYQTPGQSTAFEAYKNAVNATQKTRNGVAVSGKVSEQEYSRSSGMQKQYGTYQNYLRGVEAAQGLKLGTLALQGQSALLAGRFAPATQQVREDVDAQNRRAKAAQTAQRDQVRGMRRTSQELDKQIEALEIEQADTHFSGTGLSENGKSVTQLQNEIENLQAQKTAVDNQSVLARAQEAIGNLSEEDQNLLRQYRGQELNGYQVRAYAKYDAKTALNEKGYSDDTLKRLAEWQKVLDDYDNAQKLDQAAQEMGSGSFAGKAAATLFSAALAPGKALGNLESLRGVLPSWAGGYQNEDMPTNVYSPAYNATRLSSGIRQSVMQNMNPTGQFLYQAGTSALDSAVNMAVSTGLVGTVGGAAGAGAKDAVAETMNWVMGSQVAADSVYEGIQNGKSNADALVDGIVEGAIEGITEKYSVGDIIENMLSGKAVWRKVLRSFASEGAEEIASNWLNRAYDVVAKHDRGEVMSAYAAYIAEGRTPAQALAAMVGDFAKEDSLSFLAGGLSGLAMSGTYAGVNRVILEANVTQTARAVIEAGEVQDVIDYGMAQEEGTKAHQLAEELQQTVDAGGEVTQKAVEDTLREVAKEQQAAVDEGQEPRVPETLTRLEQLQAQEQQTQAQTEADEKTFQIYKSAAETAQENQRLAQQYQQEQEQNRAQQSVQAVQQAQQAAQQQYNQDSLFAPIPGTESMGELDPVQYARQQTADAEQALDEAALQQEEQYLQTQAQRAGYDEQTAAYFLNGNTTGMPAEQYAQSFGQVYAQGKLGASEQRAMRYAEGMNQDVAAAAYRAGLAAGQKGVNNGSIEVTDEGQVGQAGQRAEGQAGGVRQSTAQRQRADAGRKRAQGARDLAKAWDEVELSTLGFGKDNAQKVRVMPKGQEARSEDIQAAEKFFRSMGVQNARFFTGQLAQEIDGQTFYADAAVTEDGSVLIRADSEEYSAFELAKHEGYHLLVKRWPEMAAKIQKRLLGEGKITKAMIESYVDAYAGIYGDDTDAYVEEIVADTYAGMNRTDYSTNKLRADVKMEVGQWQKKSGSARAPPVKMSAAKDQTTKNYQGVNLAEDGSVYTYDFLTSLPDMDVTMLPEVDAVRGADNRVDTAKVVQEGMKNARAVGTERDGKVFVRNQYTGKMLRIDNSSIRHGLNGKQNRLLTNARMGVVIGDIVKNAVPINALNNKAKGVTGTYAMAAYVTDSRGREFVAIVTAEQINGNIAGVEVYDVAHAVSGRQKNSSQADTKSQRVYSIKAAKISISDLLQIVNSTHQSILPEDVLQKFGEQRNPQGDYTGKAKFSSQDGRYRDLMGEKAAQYVRRLESGLVNELAENLSVPGQAKREVLRPMAEEALRSFFTDGQLDRSKLNDLFETAYQAGIEEDTQYIEQYGDLKKFIRDQKISISETDRQDIADYNLFRKAAMGTLTISKDGLPVDVAYQQLQEMAPELFPADITAPSDQMMQIYDVARGIQKVQKTLDEYYGPQAASFKKWQQVNFTESIDRLTSGLRVAQRYLDAQNKAKEKLAIPQTAEETKQMWAQLKDARRVVEKAQSKTLLTEADQKIVNRLLRGETDPAYVAGLENGQQILKVYEAKADYDMLALKLKAWNAQRKQGLREFAEQALTEAEAVKWVDKTMGIRYQRETMERNIRDIARKGKVSDEKANEFINKYFWPVHENESKRKNYLVQQQNRIRALGLDRKVRKGNLVSESYGVQWLGEAEFNRDYLKQHPRVERRGGMTFDEWNAAIQEFEKQNPNLDLGKVRAAVKVFHEVYDKLFQDMNRVRIENGYEPVNYLQGYFPHFQENEEGGSILQKFARAAGIEGDVSPLPATINGLTANFKPGIRYMANIQNRLGYATAYDALQGFDRYIEVATDVIFHTADIQRLRALATQIRYRASDEGLKQRIDAIMMNPFLNPDEANEQVTNLTKEGRYGLSNFVDELDEYTNLLAGKKSRLDRGMERFFNRKVYNVLKKFHSRVGANMVAANVGSALTNFIPIAQAAAQTGGWNMMIGMRATLKNYWNADGLSAASVFINNRSGYGRLAESTMDKVSEKAGILMEVVDGFATGSVVRARYYQNLQRGMSEISAMQEADQFASGVMADRSKGSTPTLYAAQAPWVKLFTQFQLEVNNTLSWVFKDLYQEERKKGVLALCKAMFGWMLGSWVLNEVYEAMTGRRMGQDPFDIINDTVGDITGYQIPNTVDAMFSGKWDFATQKEDAYGVAANLTQNILGELPFTQVLTMLGLEVDNGRIAVASALPDFGAIFKAATSKDIAPEKRGYTIRRELAKPAYYLVPPFGGGQARKLIQGGVAAWKGGSYSVDNEGRDILQYPVYNDNPADRAKSWAQALLFGKTATEEAQSWVESGFKSLSAKETAAYQGMTEGGEDQRETYAFIQAARKLEKNYDKMKLLKAYDISDEAKAEYYYQVLAGDTQKAEMEPKSTQERIDYMNEKIQDAQDARQKQDLKDSIAAGTVTQEKAIQKILANDYAEDENKAYWLYKEWTGGKDYTKYGKILQTIEDGGDLKAAAKEYFDHGAEKGDIGNAITTEYKPKYIAASPEERKKLKEKLLAAYTAVGFDRGKKSKDIDKWLKE
nr:MAG TPA: hypothetical protein [Caudoviricetes sp.]